MKVNQLFWLIAIVGTLLIAACAPSPPEAPAAQAGEAEHHMEGDEHSHSSGESMAAMHNVPEEAAAVPNPIEANEESIAAGGELFNTNCALCHGESGQGDGPAAAGLEKQPANFTEAHVQELSDGALFYIISHGRPDTPMPAWEEVLDEEQRWQVVNYLRTFKNEDGEHHEDGGEHHADDEHNEGDGG